MTEKEVLLLQHGDVVYLVDRMSGGFVVRPFTVDGHDTRAEMIYLRSGVGRQLWTWNSAVLYFGRTEIAALEKFERALTANLAKKTTAETDLLLSLSWVQAEKARRES